IAESELNEYREALESSNTAEVTDLRKRIILEIHEIGQGIDTAKVAEQNKIETAQDLTNLNPNQQVSDRTSANGVQLAARVGLIHKGIGIIRQGQNTNLAATQQAARGVIDQFRQDQRQRELNTLNSLATLIINKHSGTAIIANNQSQINNLQNQLSKEKQAHSATKAAQQNAEQERDSYQQQLTQQEQKIVQQLNNSLKLGLDKNEKDLNKAIMEIQKLIAKPPIVTGSDCSSLQTALQAAQQTIIHLEKELKEKPTPFGESIKEIIKIDEKLLNENQILSIELNKQITNYQQLAQERNDLVLKQIKNINVEKISQLIPTAEKAEIEAIIQKSTSYADLAEQRNKLMSKYINHNSASLQEIHQQPQPQNKERTILISLLVVSLLSVGGLLMKLKNASPKKVIR
ncbi:178_t:CDS:2, partial [Funneliformis geosporum]